VILVEEVAPVGHGRQNADTPVSSRPTTSSWIVSVPS
jgi:hypothetical protein